MIRRVRLTGYGIWWNDRCDSTHLLPWRRAMLWGAVFIGGIALVFGAVLAWDRVAGCLR